MARTVLTPQQLTARAGQAITFVSVDAVNGMTFSDTGREVVIIECPLVTDQVTITIPSLKDPAGRLGDVGPSFFNGPSLREAFGPLDPSLFGDGLGNLIMNFTTSGNPVIALVLIP